MTKSRHDESKIFEYTYLLQLPMHALNVTLNPFQSHTKYRVNYELPKYTDPR